VRAHSLLPLALFTALVACEDLTIDGLDDDSSTQVRVLHAAPRAPIIDAILNFDRIAKNLHYLDVSDYVGVEENEHTLEFRMADARTVNQPILGKSFLSVERHQRYTILAVDSFPDVLDDQGGRVLRRRDGIEPLTLLDDPTVPLPGTARLRFVAAAPSTLLADVYITAPAIDIRSVAPTFSSMAFHTVATYITLPAGLYRLRVTTAGTKTVVLDVDPFILTAGQVQTAVMLDGPAGGTPSILRRLTERIVQVDD
jgi:hypothetical protein